jgi:circadian clock protein KaiC
MTPKGTGAKTIPINQAKRVPTGVSGLDDILGGGLTANRLYLLEGSPGTGKTTLALHFLREGAARGENVLYITLSETAEELHSVAASHGWTLDGINIFELISEAALKPEGEQSILHPADVELGETTRRVMDEIDARAPARLVFDSLSELRLLAQNALRYRRQILTLKYFLSQRRCTVLLLDDCTSGGDNLQVHSIAHGVVSLELMKREYGTERRRLRIAKMRGIKFRDGYHDFVLETGGLRVFPRLVAAGHKSDFNMTLKPTGSRELDQMLGGGLAVGSNILMSGPSGVGKSTTAVRCVLSALERGEHCAYFAFDEGLTTLLLRCASLGMDLRPYISSGQLKMEQVDPAELAPGEFVSHVRACVREGGASTVVIDGLNAYLQTMPHETFLILQMHDLLSFLNQQGIITIVLLAHHGVVGETRAEIDISYLSDTLVLFRYFEAKGEILSAVSVLKSRTSAHERTIREFKLSEKGLTVGQSLSDFEGILSGVPIYRGSTPMLASPG